MKKKSLDKPFEEALNELEKVIKNLEEGDLTLEESLLNFERGVKLYRHCNNMLNNAEQKIKMIIENENGNYEEVNFDNN